MSLNLNSLCLSKKQNNKTKLCRTKFVAIIKFQKENIFEIIKFFI